MGEIVIYEQEGKAVEVRLDGDTVWLTQQQMADVLETKTTQYQHAYQGDICGWRACGGGNY